MYCLHQTLLHQPIQQRQHATIHAPYPRVLLIALLSRPLHLVSTPYFWGFDRFYAATNIETAPAPTVVPPSPRAAGEVANCTTWVAPSSVDTCAGILALYQLTIAQFYAFNPLSVVIAEPWRSVHIIASL